MSVIFSNILKSQKTPLKQWKPGNNCPVLLKVAILVQLMYQSVLLATDGEDGNGLQLEKGGSTFLSSRIVS